MRGHKPVSYAYVKGRGTDGSMVTVIASIETALAYTPQPPIIRAYCSLHALLRFRCILSGKVERCLIVSD